MFSYALFFIAAVASLATEPPARTSLSDPSIKFKASDKPHVVLKRGALEAVIVDNRAVDDAVLPGHRAGYHGVASLKHTAQDRNLFVPAYSGLNFEHIHDGTRQDQIVLFEPRNAPMQLRVIDSHTAELHQPPTPFWGLESCLRYQLLENDALELTYECIPRRAKFKNGYIGLFWASYINQPEDKSILFFDSNRQWTQAISPEHGVLATHPGATDDRDFAHDPQFPLTLVFNNSKYRYGEPWYLGQCRGMIFAQIFRPADQVRMSQSPSGGGTGNPAWDFQWFIPNPQIGQRYQLIMRSLYIPPPQKLSASTKPGAELLKTIQQISP